jgi:hypothetical protein
LKTKPTEVPLPVLTCPTCQKRFSYEIEPNCTSKSVRCPRCKAILSLKRKEKPSFATDPGPVPIRPKPSSPDKPFLDPDLSLPLDKIRFRNRTRLLFIALICGAGIFWALRETFREPPTPSTVIYKEVKEEPKELVQLRQKEEEARRRLEIIEQELTKERKRQEAIQKAEQEAQEAKERAEQQKRQEELALKRAEEERQRQKEKEERRQEEARKAWENSPRGKRSIEAHKALVDYIKTQPTSRDYDLMEAGIFLHKVCKTSNGDIISYKQAELLLDSEEGQNLTPSIIAAIDDVI